MKPRTILGTTAWYLAFLLWGASMMHAAVDAQSRPQMARPQMAHPQRIVSTNYCTDQILIRLVEPERIASLTYLSWVPGDTPPEYLHALEGLKQNHGLAEEVLTLEPDLILSGAYSARFSNVLMQKMGYKVLLTEPEETFEAWYNSIRRIGEAVGEPERAARMIADFQNGLATLKAQIPPGEAPIYVSLTVNNWMPGKGTLETELANAGGFRTAGEYVGFSGYRGIPLEQLITIPIDLISGSSKQAGPPSMATQNLRHPLLRMLAAKAVAEINIPGRYTACTTPETLKMVELLVDARRKVDAAKAARRGGG